MIRLFDGCSPLVPCGVNGMGPETISTSVDDAKSVRLHNNIMCGLDGCLPVATSGLNGKDPEMISTSVDDAESISIGRLMEEPGNAMLKEVDLDICFSILLGPGTCFNRRST